MSQKVSCILKTLVFDGQISLAVLDTTSLVNELIARHGLTPVTAAALGRTATACAYLCSWLKSDVSTLHVAISGGGSGGTVSVSGDGALHIRGNIANPSFTLPLRADGKLDVGGCVGKNGTITVVRDDGDGLPFVGTSALLTGEIAEDFSAYFLTSEQRPTAIALGVRVSGNTCLGAGGVFLQPLPGASEEAISYAEEKIARYADISAAIALRSPRDILKKDFGAENYERRRIVFRCSCSRKKAGSAVLALGYDGARALLKEEGKIKVHCHDCNTDYLFDEGELESLFGRKK